MEEDDAHSLHPQNGADTEVVIANSHRSTPPPILELPSRNRSPSPEVVADEALHPSDADGMVLVEAANGDISESEATALTAAPTPLVKGKTTLDETRMVRYAPGEVDRASERGSVAREVLNVSEAQILGQTFTSSLDPFLLDIGSSTPPHQQASRRRGTNEQEGSPRLEEGKFPLLVSSPLQY
jgi:hypothetical protein